METAPDSPARVQSTGYHPTGGNNISANIPEPQIPWRQSCNHMDNTQGDNKEDTSLTGNNGSSNRGIILEKMFCSPRMMAMRTSKIMRVHTLKRGLQCLIVERGLTISKIVRCMLARLQVPLAVSKVIFHEQQYNDPSALSHPMPKRVKQLVAAYTRQVKFRMGFATLGLFLLLYPRNDCWCLF